MAVLARDDRVALLFGVPIPLLRTDRDACRRAARRSERRVERLHRPLEDREVDQVALAGAQ